MGFQQQILDNLLIAFVSAVASLVVVIPANLIGLWNPYIGCLVNLIGISSLFFLLYKYYYQKKYQNIEQPSLTLWWVYLSLSFAFTFSVPIIQREKWLSFNLFPFMIFIPLMAYIFFELYSFRLGIKNWIKS